MTKTELDKLRDEYFPLYGDDLPETNEQNIQNRLGFDEAVDFLLPKLTQAKGREEKLVGALKKIQKYHASNYVHRSFMDDMYEIRNICESVLKELGYEGAGGNDE